MLVTGFYSSERRAHPPLPAGANVDHGDSVVITEDHRNRAAGSGWMMRLVSNYLILSVNIHTDIATKNTPMIR